MFSCRCKTITCVTRKFFFLSPEHFYLHGVCLAYSHAFSHLFISENVPICYLRVFYVSFPKIRRQTLQWSYVTYYLVFFMAVFHIFECLLLMLFFIIIIYLWLLIYYYTYYCFNMQLRYTQVSELRWIEIIQNFTWTIICQISVISDKWSFVSLRLILIGMLSI